MNKILTVLKFLIITLYSVESQRPNFRSDYLFEKAFNAFYKVHTSPQEWHRARVRCEAEGSELMVPDNLDEADALPLLTTDILTKYEGVFVGMHDLYSERIFVTLNGSRLLGSILDLLWELKEPAYKGGRCVAMRRSGRLFVQPCNKQLPFICKISAERIVYKEDCDTYNLNWTRGPRDSCYMAHVEPQSWHDAHAACLLGGGHLAVLDDRAEAEYIRLLFKQIEEKRMPFNDFAFLGFTDLFQRHHYRTVFGTRIQDGFSDWDNKCSAAEAPLQKSLQRCGGVRRSGLLMAADCASAAMFFCEKKANKSDRDPARLRTAKRVKKLRRQKF